MVEEDKPDPTTNTDAAQAEFKDVDEASDESLLFIGQMETIETMTEKKFELF